ncbi:MAG: translation initiation factor IF-2 [Bacteroidetes bacterium]|nr:translation initiation factor IF-2 [Bacteroidota bacterium]
MSEGSVTSTRLSKAAREFNIGTSTIVEFLLKKGFQVDSNPNTRITPEMYALLLKEFQAEKQVKEEAQKIGIDHSGRKTITAEHVVNRTDADEDEDVDTDELIIKNVTSNYVDIKHQKAEKAEPEKPAPKPEAAPAPAVVKPVEPKVEAVKLPVAEPKSVDPVAEKPAAAPKAVEEQPKAVVQPKEAEPQPKTTIIEKPVVAESAPIDTVETEPAQEAGKADGELKIVGRIDLDSLNQRTKPDRKSKAQKLKEAEDKRQAQKDQKTVRKQEPEPVAAPEAVTTEEVVKPAAAEVAAEPVQDIRNTERAINFMPTEVRKLEGPKILDKIELPVERKGKAKPVASSTEDKLGAAKKKKRKRIRNNKVQEADNKPKPAEKDQPARKGKLHIPAVRKEDKPELTEEDIQRQIKETLARLSPLGKSKTSKHRRQKRESVSHSMQEEMARREQDSTKLKVTEFVTANELATMMNVPVNKVIATCMSLGLFVSINQRLDAETLTLVAEEFGFQVEFVSAELQEAINESEEEDNIEDLEERAPIVTVMGHVDHGKTLLLDYIRKSNVVAGEAGGITQHIGAYEVFNENGRKITFLDTPGHEAFTAMRARGAKITDVAIIVIAADDSVMPQTVEAINHAQAAGVPIVFAFNKIDKPSANAERIREQLANMNILVEDWGGKYQCQEVSAKSGLGVDQLLEKVLLEAEILELKGNAVKPAKGTVIESSLDKGRGYVAKILVQDGTMRIGDIVLAGATFGKVKAMFNERNKLIKEAGPATPLLLLGLNGAPQAGDSFNVMLDEKEAKNIAFKRQQLQREQGLRTQKHITLDEIGRRIAIGDFKELNLIVKADVDGSVEALSDSLLKLTTKEVQVNVIHKSVGAITESDILLASASNAIVIGFQVRPSLSARKLAEQEEIDIRLYSIIYQAIEEIKAAIEGMLSPEIEEVITCNVEVREIFKISKVGTIAGCMVLDGKVNRNVKIRLIRDGIVIYSGSLGSLKRFKDDVKEVSAGYECGLNIDGFNDIKVGDIVEGYTEREVSRKL